MFQYFRELGLTAPAYAATFRYGSERRNNYVLIDAINTSEAQSKMIACFGIDWSMLYENDETFKRDVEVFQLTQIATIL